jgi:hypothetical protein
MVTTNIGLDNRIHTAWVPVPKDNLRRAPELRIGTYVVSNPNTKPRVELHLFVSDTLYRLNGKPANTQRLCMIARTKHSIKAMRLGRMQVSTE